MDRVFIPFIGFCFIVLQSTLIGYTRIFGVAPDLVFLFIVFLALHRQNTSGLWAAFILGLFQDIAGGGILGLNAFLLLGMTYLGIYLRRKFFQENLISQILIIMLFTLLHQFLIFFWMNTLLGTEFHLAQWVGRALGRSFYHALLTPFLFQVLKKMLPDQDASRNLVAGQSGSRSRFSKTPRTG